MDREVLKQEINLLVKDLLTEQGFVLVDIIFRQNGSGLLLSLFVDRPQARELPVKSNSQNRNLRFRPNVSLRYPAGGMAMAAPI